MSQRVIWRLQNRNFGIRPIWVHFPRHPLWTYQGCFLNRVSTLSSFFLHTLQCNFKCAFKRIPEFFIKEHLLLNIRKKVKDNSKWDFFFFLKKHLHGKHIHFKARAVSFSVNPCIDGIAQRRGYKMEYGKSRLCDFVGVY